MDIDTQYIIHLRGRECEGAAPSLQYKGMMLSVHILPGDAIHGDGEEEAEDGHCTPDGCEKALHMLVIHGLKINNDSSSQLHC